MGSSECSLSPSLSMSSPSKRSPHSTAPNDSLALTDTGNDTQTNATNEGDILKTPEKVLDSSTHSTPPSSVVLEATPLPSPKKTPTTRTPLPPVHSEQLQISKRRRLTLEPSQSDVVEDANLLTVTPSKIRSVSTPVQTRRTPSLQDRPIPVLSPPSPLNRRDSKD